MVVMKGSRVGCKWLSRQLQAWVWSSCTVCPVFLSAVFVSDQSLLHLQMQTAMERSSPSDGAWTVCRQVQLTKLEWLGQEGPLLLLDAVMREILTRRVANSAVCRPEITAVVMTVRAQWWVDNAEACRPQTWPADISTFQSDNRTNWLVGVVWVTVEEWLAGTARSAAWVSGAQARPSAHDPHSGLRCAVVGGKRPST